MSHASMYTPFSSGALLPTEHQEKHTSAAWSRHGGVGMTA
jgi:hypothetical protein